jgi:filamentous hemagglutinin family protein
MAMIRLGLVSLVALATAQVAHAQTNIVPDTVAGVDLGTTVTQNNNTYTIDNGTLSGTNLFHSFSTFDIGAGDVAQWVYTAGNAASIENVINRVTGGSPSTILGTLDSTAIPNADFYFINPAGIIFSGQGAQVNVPAAAHFSTASELQFSNGQVFSVATPSGSTLSVAAPQAFGFIGNEGNIAISGVGAPQNFAPQFITNGASLSLTASDISIDNSNIVMNGLVLAAVGGGPAVVPLTGADVALGGTLSITNAEIRSTHATAQAGRPVRVSAGHIETDNGSIIAFSEGTGAVGGIDILADTISLSGGTIETAAFIPDSPISGDGGDIVIHANAMTMLNGAWVQASSFGSGRGGDITVDIAGPLVMNNNSRFTSSSFASGKGGTISVSADSAQLSNHSFINAVAYSNGDGGYVGF